MIQQGDMTIIETVTYRCLRIDGDGYAHLKNILHEQGRPKLVLQKYCPYILNNQIIIPEKPVYKRPKATTKLSITKIIRENTDLQVSNDARLFITEWVETAVSNMIANAEENAINRGDSRITEAHFFWLETNSAPNGYWPSNKEYMKE